MNERLKRLFKRSYYISFLFEGIKECTENVFIEIDELLDSCREAETEQILNILSEHRKLFEKANTLCARLKKRKRLISKTKRLLFLRKVQIQQELKSQILCLYNGIDSPIASSSSEHSGRQEIEKLEQMIEQLKDWEEKYEYMSSRACTKLRGIKKQINELLKRSEQKALERKEKRLADEKQRKLELEEAKRHIF